jgi:hypothetical protein
MGSSWEQSSSEFSGVDGQKISAKEIVRTGMEIRMFVFRRRIFMKRSVHAAMAVAGVFLIVTETGCESTPIRAFRGARHYAAGTEALERDDDIGAIAELEQAAVLVPHASEIQNHLGLAYWSDGRPQSAQVAFEKAIELDCDNAAARINLERLMRSDDLIQDVGRDTGSDAGSDAGQDVVVEAVVEAGVEGTNGVDENGE